MDVLMKKHSTKVMTVSVVGIKNLMVKILMTTMIGLMRVTNKRRIWEEMKTLHLNVMIITIHTI